MDFNKFKQLKKYIDKQDYFSNWIGIKNGAVLFSYLAQGAIIAFGYFYIFSIIINVEDSWDPWIISLISIVFLGGYEIFKRSITDKWAQDVVKRGFKTATEFMLLTISSVLLYSGSFYVSLHGAMMFADRSVQIEETTFTDINVIKDSINTKYTTQLLKLDSTKNSVNRQKINDPAIISYNKAVQQYSERAWRTDEQLVQTLKPGYENTIIRYNNDLDDIDERITSLRTQQQTDITAAENRLTEKSETKTALSKISSSRFVILSIMFELMIIFGVWFRRYFQHRSLQDWKEKLQTDPKLARWYKWDQILGILYREKFTPLETGNQAPAPKDLAATCKLDNIFMSESEVKELYKSLVALEILESRGSRRYILQNFDGAKKTLAMQFGIDSKKNQ